MRGRPPTPLIERLRVITWSHHVMAASGVLHAKEFESLHWRDAKRTVRIANGLWSRYLRGEVAPLGGKDKNRHSLVQHLERQYPTTGDIFLHPVWDLLDFTKIYTPAQMKSHYLSLGEAVWLNFVKGGRATSQDPHFWRIHRSETDRMRFLTRLDNLDGLAACLIEARMGYLEQKPEVVANSLLVACRALLARLRKETVFNQARVLSVLWAIEGVCLDYCRKILQGTDGQTSTGDGYASALLDWEEDWDDGVAEHEATLSASAGSVFRSWLR